MSRAASVSVTDPSAPRSAERRIVSPEGVPLVFEVANISARFGALALDMILIGLGFMIVALTFFLGGGLFGNSDAFLLTLGTLMVGWFVVRNFYWSFCEIKYQGATPGKRMFGVRVIDRRGGPLTGPAICARNFTREIEFWLPLMALGASGQVFPSLPGWAQLVCVAWLIAIVILPFCTKERLRLGDYVGGTMVVKSPRVTLLKDLARADSKLDAVAPMFSREQLDIYGIYELQILEDLLRAGRDADKKAVRTVAATVKKKIGWIDGSSKMRDLDFLKAFYKAQRGRLEDKLRLGQRQEHKRKNPEVS